MLLRTRLASRLAVWETTNANPGNKFIDAEGARNLHRCLAVLSPSAIIDRGIRETYGYQGPIVRLPFWIPDGPHTPRRDADRFAYDFAYVGRLDVEKGLNELISAFAGLLKKRLARLAICGFGKAEPFQARARALGIAASLDFKPNASEEAVEQVMRSARWYVLPSYHEGYPLGVLEAARQGMPIIAASVGSIPEMLAASEAGLLVPPRDGGALTRAMLLGLLEPEVTYLRRCGEARSLFLRLSGAPSVRERLAAATLTLRTLSRKRQSGTSSQSGARR
jgi:glycosyltransferase involved in cell wall biosynthesis